MIMILKNKWNGRLYELVEDKGNVVTLKRCKDEKLITISKKEVLFSYKEFKDKGKITFLNTVDSEEVRKKLNGGKKL